MSSDDYGIDSHKLIYHPDRVAALVESYDQWEKAKKIYPIYMEIAPVGSCNHRCTFCSVDYVGYKRVAIELDAARRFLPELGSAGVKSIMYAGEGEPLLHQDISEIVCLTKEAGIDVSFTTNASVMPEGFLERALPRISWLKASVNAGTPETYAKIHGVKEGMFGKVMANLKSMADAKRRGQLQVTLGAQILMLPENAHEIERLAVICRDEVGLDYLVVKPYTQSELSSNRKYENLDYSKWAADWKKYTDLSSSDFKLIYRRNTMEKYNSAERYPRCHAVPFLWAYVMADGTVSCCSAYLLDKRFEIGNIKQTPFQELWEGDRRRHVWELVRNDLDISECRRNCRMDEVNRYLYRLLDNPPPHVNFI